MHQVARRTLTLVLVAILLNIAACGYLIYPERQGLRGEHVDGAVVALDAVGLLFFVLPGVVAFAVDFATGCVYLPQDKASGFSLNEPAPAGWVPVVKVAPFAGDAEIAAALQSYLQNIHGQKTHGQKTHGVLIADNSVRIQWLPGAAQNTLPITIAHN